MIDSKNLMIEKDVEVIKTGKNVYLDYYLCYLDFETLGKTVISSMIQFGSILNGNEFCEMTNPKHVHESKYQIR